ncbi:MAG: lipopolysaccharide biosynthesis protein, partial [Candidatus Omnitrophica bacterium]|nr:lipopolysaccharide biosynthesis protein [Candidatus Omnitrophota bacterium]
MEQATTLRDFLKVLFRQKAVVLTSFITVAVTVAVGLKFQTPVFEGTVKMMVSAEKQVESPYYQPMLGTRNMEVALAQSEIVTSNPVIERAVRAVGLFERPLDYEKNFASRLKRPFIIWGAQTWEKKLAQAPEEQRKGLKFRIVVEDLKRHVKVEPVRDTNLFTITVRDYSQVGSAILANVVSRSYIIFDLQQQLAETQLKYGEKHPSSIQLQDSIDAMIKNLNGQPLPDVEAIGPASVKIVEQASLPLQPAGIPKVLTFILGIFM